MLDAACNVSNVSRRDCLACLVHHIVYQTVQSTRSMQHWPSQKDQEVAQSSPVTAAWFNKCWCLKSSIVRVESSALTQVDKALAACGFGVTNYVSSYSRHEIRNFSYSFDQDHCKTGFLHREVIQLPHSAAFVA